MWSVKQKGHVFAIHCKQGDAYPQCAAFHLKSGYFRMNCGPGTGWGTSVIVLPSFWERGIYFQGSPVSMSYQVSTSGDLTLNYFSKLSTLRVNGCLTLSPTCGKTVSAIVRISTEGSVPLDESRKLSFKPVFLSSMHISETHCDTSGAAVKRAVFELPEKGKIFDAPIRSKRFGLNGGSSKWKKRYPSVAIKLDRSMRIAGWVSRSDDPNDDNVGLWAACDEVLSDWTYTICYTAE